MDEEILKNIWNALSSDKKTESDFETWKSNFSGNSEVQDNVHVYLTQKGYTKNDLETWRTNLGIKKKTIPISLQKRSLRNPLQMWKQIRPPWTLLQQQQALMYL